MKTGLGGAVAVILGLAGFCQGQDYISASPVVVVPAVVYQAPVVYEAPVIYQAPVVYQAPVIYSPVQTYGAVCAEPAAPTATVVYIGGGCPRVETYYNDCGPSSPVIYFGGGQARREGYNFHLRR